MELLILMPAGLLSRLSWLLILFAVLADCGRPGKETPSAVPWTTGFWFWGGSSASVASAVNPVEVLYFQAGTIDRRTYTALGPPWSIRGEMPEWLPPAREYWAVFRFDDAGVPALEVAPKFAPAVLDLQKEARRRGLKLAGIQLDIDAPTRMLPQYAALLREVRKDLPAGVQLSITALLDWFRDGTAFGEVAGQVDEFVPQFYDVEGRTSHRGGAAIAAPVSAAKWGATFQRHGKRFRIGVATFGRARLVRGESVARSGDWEAARFSDLTPLDVAVDPAFVLDTSRTEADEQAVRYRATRKTGIGFTELKPGDMVEFILSTPEAIRAAVEQAKLFRGHCAGVVFFRWPGLDETLAMPPDQVFSAAGVLPPKATAAEIRAVDGECAAVYCADLYLVNSDRLSGAPVRYRIVSSMALEYFLPAEPVPVRMTGASRIELTLPPYCGRSRLHLGRAVAAQRARFKLEEVR